MPARLAHCWFGIGALRGDQARAAVNVDTVTSLRQRTRRPLKRQSILLRDYRNTQTAQRYEILSNAVPTLDFNAVLDATTATNTYCQYGKDARAAQGILISLVVPPSSLFLNHGGFSSYEHVKAKDRR